MNICLVGDSISHNVDTLEVERATGSIISKSKAYGSVRDNKSLYPQKNFTDVVPEKMIKKYNQSGMDFDLLLLQASSTDITNLDTSKINDKVKVDLKRCSLASSENMFNVAVNAVNNTDVSKVIIMERIPRFDSTIKSELSELANGHLHHLLYESDYKDKIMIGQHRIMCNADNRSDVYGAGRGFDGIHARGPAGHYSLTKSLINILKEVVRWPSSSSSSSRNFSSPFSRSSKSASSNNPEPQVGTSTSNTKSQHNPVFLNRGNIRDFYYNRNIFDTLQNVNNSGN